MVYEGACTVFCFYLVVISLCFVLTNPGIVKKALQDNDMDDVFIVPTSFDADGIHDTNNFVDLLNTTYGITLDLVTQASAVYSLKSSASS